VSRQQLHITLAGREHVVDAGTTASDALQNGAAGEPPESTVIAARINGELRDLATRLADGDEVAGVEIASDDGRAILRHSTAHVMAQAVQELFPEAKLGIGPPVEAGFYYDFDVEHPFGPDDLKAIEGRMRAIVKKGQRFSRRVVSEAAPSWRRSRTSWSWSGSRARPLLRGVLGGRHPRSALPRRRSRSAVPS